MLFIILVACSLIGRYLSRKYIIRVNELEEMRNALNMLQSKIKFTYEPIPEIFEEMNPEEEEEEEEKEEEEEEEEEEETTVWLI